MGYLSGHSPQFNYKVTLRANTLLFVSPRNSFTSIFVVLSLIIDLIMKLSERRNFVAFLNF